MSNAPHIDESVTARAPGKVNLFLGVGPLRDDGYHELATVFQAVSLCEEVTATPAADIRIMGITGTVDLNGVPIGEGNLALRAAQLLAERTGVREGAHLRIRKGVPVAGGMGGGSADAAATLVACNELWRTELSTSALMELGAELGADVPFAILGGTAVGSGRGETLTPALARSAFAWVFVTSPQGLSTPLVFDELDRLRGGDETGGEIPPELLFALSSGDAHRLAAALGNELQRATLSLRPELAGTIERGVAAGALAGIVSGSGPTVALLCRDGEHADAVARAFDGEAGKTFLAMAPAAGTRLI